MDRLAVVLASLLALLSGGGPIDASQGGTGIEAAPPPMDAGLNQPPPSAPQSAEDLGEFPVSGSIRVPVANQVLFALLLCRLRLRHTAIVRTAHNLRLPEGISRRETALLRLADRWTTLRIRLNTTTEMPAGQPFVTIPHGHYRDWYRRFDKSVKIPGRIVYFGLIRRYKGVDGLIDAFRNVPGAADLQLVVAGRPSSPELAAQLRDRAAVDDRVDLRLEFQSDDELAGLVTTAELVVLPYREMHNSGGALAALSLARPVMMPDNVVNRSLSDEIGPGWIFGYDGDLTSEHLLDAVASLRTAPPASEPDLSRRDWDTAGAAHLAAYREAVRLAKGRNCREAPAL